MLVPVRSRDHPWGHVVARDPHAGQRIRCGCGAERWTTYGGAAHHGRTCPVALMYESRREERRGAHGTARRLRDRAIAEALRTAGRSGATARTLAAVLGYSPSYVRELLRAAERVGIAERRGRPPYAWRRRRT